MVGPTDRAGSDGATQGAENRGPRGVHEGDDLGRGQPGCGPDPCDRSLRDARGIDLPAGSALDAAHSDSVWICHWGVSSASRQASWYAARRAFCVSDAWVTLTWTWSARGVSKERAQRVHGWGFGWAACPLPDPGVRILREPDREPGRRVLEEASQRADPAASFRAHHGDFRVGSFAFRLGLRGAGAEA